MAKTHTGNGQEQMPARMVGNVCCSFTRQSGRDAAHEFRTSSEVHGRASLHFFFVFLLFVFFFQHPVWAVGEDREELYKSATPEEIEVARGMESLMVDLVIQEMRKSIPENDIIPVTNGEKIYRQMLDTEYAKEVSRSGNLGIADLVLAQLKGKR